MIPFRGRGATWIAEGMVAPLQGGVQLEHVAIGIADRQRASGILRLAQEPAHIRHACRPTRLRHDHRRTSSSRNQTIGRELVVGRQHRVTRDAEQPRQHAARGQPTAVCRPAANRLLHLPSDLAMQWRQISSIEDDRWQQELAASAHELALSSGSLRTAEGGRVSSSKESAHVFHR